MSSLYVSVSMSRRWIGNDRRNRKGILEVLPVLLAFSEDFLDNPIGEE